MRGYTVAAAAVTLGMSAKWVDNTLSHHHVNGVSRSRQGVSRKLSRHAVTTLAIAIRLVRLLSVPLASALKLANQALETVAGSPATLHLSPAIAVVVDAAAIARETVENLANAVEIAPTPKRGRPLATDKKKGASRRPSKVTVA